MSLRFVFYFANSEYPDKMPLRAASHLCFAVYFANSACPDETHAASCDISPGSHGYKRTVCRYPECKRLLNG